LRIIAGTRKGYKLHPIKGRVIRPTADRIRESIFNILGRVVIDAVVLDLYAGTGGVGIEALSRGASVALFVEKSPYSLRTITQNLNHLNLTNQGHVFKRDILNGLSWMKTLGHHFDIVFMDPPYNKNYVAKTLLFLSKAEILSPASQIIAEHSAREAVPESMGNLVLYDQRKYGKIIVSFYEQSPL
jgi:16S rRNA (guanine(966)-N(2))-methyltransferase RsmD